MSEDRKKAKKLAENIMIRKVAVLRGRARKEADKMNLGSNDLVIVRTHISKETPIPEYELEKVEGDPVSYLEKRLLKEREEG